MKTNKLLDITVPTLSRQNTLEKILKYISANKEICHIVSLNPEILVLTQNNYEFKKAVETAQIKIIDGIGVVLAGRILGLELGERFSGVDLMEELINQANKLRLRVLLIGGKPNLALDLVDCYSKDYSEAKFFGLEGIHDIKNPKESEEKLILDIVRRNKPHIILVAFGSPDQELWIERHKRQFTGSVVMGVGGAFDFLSGEINRAPNLMRYFGLEWLFRLINQPWRWRRQLRLLEFIKLVILEKWRKT